MANQETPWRLRDLVEALFRHWKKSLALAISVLATGVLTILFAPRTYRSEAKVFLQRGRETVGLDPTATTGQTVSLMQSDREDEIQSAMDILRSRGVLARAVERLTPEVVLGKVPLQGDETPSGWSDSFAGLKSAAIQAVRSIDPVPDVERAVLELEQELEIDAQRNSTVLEVRYDAATPKLAQAVLRKVVDAYREEHARVFRNEKSRQFFDEQRSLLRQRVEEAAKGLQEAKDEMGFASIAARSQTLEQLFASVSQDRNAAQQELATTHARVDNLERQLKNLPERETTAKKSIPNQGADLLRDQLYELQVKQSDLRARYNDAHPLVQAVAEQVAEAERIVKAQAVVREETTDDVNPIHRELALQHKRDASLLAGLEARCAELDKQHAAIHQEMLLLNQAEAKIQQLQREHDLAQANFLQYAENFEQARIDKEMEAAQISNLSFFQEPTLNFKPVSPSKPLVAVACLALSVLAPLALVLFCERADDRLRRTDDIERALGAPVLAQFPNAPRPWRTLSESSPVPR